MGAAGGALAGRGQPGRGADEDEAAHAGGVAERDQERETSAHRVAGDVGARDALGVEAVGEAVGGVGEAAGARVGRVPRLGVGRAVVGCSGAVGNVLGPVVHVPGAVMRLAGAVGAGFGRLGGPVAGQVRREDAARGEAGGDGGPVRAAAEEAVQEQDGRHGSAADAPQVTPGVLSGLGPGQPQGHPAGLGGVSAGT